MNKILNGSLPALPVEEPPLYIGRITPIAFEALIGIFYGIAIILALIRLMLQLRIHRCFYADDYFLIFACVCLTAGTALGYANIGSLYWSQELNYNPTHIYYLLADRVDIGAGINKYQRIWYGWTTLLWATIFVVKFAYLAFFKRLIARVKSLIIYWRVVVVITVISCPVCIVSPYVACVKWGLEAAQCLEPVYFRRALGLAILDIVLDVGTDLLIVGIAVQLLWSVKIKPSQKFVIGVFLSLNLIMAITASVRVSGLKFRGTFDEVWLFFWQHAEACVAISMVSLTAFRSVFVGAKSTSAQKEAVKKPWYSSAIVRNRNKRNADEEICHELPKIPSATLSGMRTMINGGRGTLASNGTGTFRSISEENTDKWPLRSDHHEST